MGLNITWWETTLAGISTLAIFSFLYKENIFYRFFEHLFIGIATGIAIMSTFNNYLWPKAFKPLLGFDRIPFPDGTFPEPYNQNLLLLILPICFGLLYYFILSKKHNWIAQIVIGFILGVTAGLAFKGTFNEMQPQLVDSFRSVYVKTPEGSIDKAESINNFLFIFILLTVSSYFFFTFKRKPGGVIEKSSAIGRWMMMGCFGAFFGATIMARMALLVERLEFMINQWWPNFFGS